MYICYCLYEGYRNETCDTWCLEFSFHEGQVTFTVYKP